MEQPGEVALAEPRAVTAIVYVLVIAESFFQDSSVAASQPRSPIAAGRRIRFEREIDLKFRESKQLLGLSLGLEQRVSCLSRTETQQNGA